MTMLHSPPDVSPEVIGITAEQMETYINRWQSKLIHLAASYLRDLQAAEDCVQDVFITAMHKLNGNLPEGAIHKWLMTCTMNRAKTILKSIRTRRLIHMDHQTLDQQGVPVADAYAALDETGVLGKVLGLPVKYREVIVLKYYHDLALTEISSVLDIPENTVKTRLRRGKELLRNVLETERGTL